MKKIKIESWLPVFPGFYSTVFEPSEDSEIDDIDSQRKRKGLKLVSFDDIEFDYKEYENRVAEACTGFIENELNDVFKNKLVINMQAVSSPKEYNFHNDAIHVEIIVTKAFLDELRTYLTKHRKEFDTYTLDRYTSRDGFLSSHSNDSEIWMHDYFNKMQDNGHYLGSLLQFVCDTEGIDQEGMYDDVCGEMYLTATNYHELTEGKG